MRLLSGSNAKLEKAEKFGWLNIGLSLAPHKTAGVGNMCSHASPTCIKNCLNLTGRGLMDQAQAARIRRTRLFKRDKKEFFRQVRSDLESALRKTDKVACRMNVFSDIPWENVKVPGEGVSIFQLYPEVAFYDYTKIPDRNPEGCHLTFSLSEDNEDTARRELDAGKNLAVVFNGEYPSTFWGYDVVDGDENDLRFLDPSPCVVALKAKGSMRKDTSGFVRTQEGVLV